MLVTILYLVLILLFWDVVKQVVDRTFKSRFWNLTFKIGFIIAPFGVLVILLWEILTLLVEVFSKKFIYFFKIGE